MLPPELIAQLNTDYSCRDQQVRQLAALYATRLPSPPTLNVYGLTATGKTLVLSSFLRLSQIPHVIVNVRECITARHLLEQVISSVLDALDEIDDTTADRRPFARTENFSALCVHLAKLLQGREKFVLVLDALDRLREGGVSGGSGTLVAAMARMAEIIPGLSMILTSTLALTPSLLRSASTIFLHFPNYSRNEAITILAQHPPKIFLTPPTEETYAEYTPDLAAEDDAWLWNRFLSAVYDTLTKHTGKDLVSFRRCATGIWRQFVDPIVTGQFGTRDFSRLMVNRRHLFQTEDSVLDRVIADASHLSVAVNNGTSESSTISKRRTARTLALVHDLPFYATHLLVAAYLASYNPSRTDVTYFMKHTDKRKNKRRAPSTTVGVTKSKHRKISRHLLTPGPFPLDRLFAIFRALIDGAVPQVADLYTQIATLSSMRLLVRAGAGANDALEPGARWRVNFGWEVARGLGRGVGIEVGEFLVGGVD